MGCRRAAALLVLTLLPPPRASTPYDDVVADCYFEAQCSRSVTPNAPVRSPGPDAAAFNENEFWAPILKEALHQQQESLPASQAATPCPKTYVYEYAQPHTSTRPPGFLT